MLFAIDVPDDIFLCRRPTIRRFAGPFPAIPRRRCLQLSAAAGVPEGEVDKLGPKAEMDVAMSGVQIGRAG